MCGLVALLGLGPDALETSLQAALHALAARGPDGEGRVIWRERGLALGHRRLATHDLGGGHQPYRLEGGDVALALNGDLYELDALRARLEKRGHVFRTRSEAEALGRLYLEHRDEPEAFSRELAGLQGEFSLLIADIPRRRLLAACDAAGVRSLSIGREGKRLRIASTVRALFAAGHPRAWDERSLGRAAALQYAPPRASGRTLFRDVAVLAPGTLRVWDTRTAELLYSVGKPSGSPSRPSPLPPETSTPALADALLRAVSRRVPREPSVSFACALSGGLDSSLVLALAAREVACAPPALTVAFEDDPLDEVRAAADTARHVGAPHHVVRITRAEVADQLPGIARDGEGPAINAHLVGKWRLAQAAASLGAKVLLHGEGADEVALGYPHLLRDEGLAGDIPSAAALEGAMLARSGSRDEGAGNDPSVPHFIHAKRALGAQIAALSTFGPPEPRANEALQAMRAMVSIPFREGGARAAVALWRVSAFHTYILETLADRVEFAHGIASRPPFLDAEVERVAAQIPARSWMQGGVEKAPLRTLARDHGWLPAAVCARRKQPFWGPVMVARPGPVMELARDALLGPAAPVFVDRPALREVLDDLSGDCDAPLRRAWEPALFWLLTTALVEAGLLR